MKNVFFFALANILTICYLSAQNPSRKVITVLEENESIYSNEYFLTVSLNGLRYGAFIKNGENMGRLIINDKEFDFDQFDDLYVNSYYEGHEYGIGVLYKKNSEQYVNLNGKTWGPFFHIRNFSLFKNNNSIFNYYTNDNSFININGESFKTYNKITKREFYSDESYYYDYAYDPNYYVFGNGMFYFTYKRNDGEYININNDVLGPFDFLSYEIKQNGDNTLKYRLDYEINGNRYVRFNDKTYGPFSSIKKIDGKDYSLRSHNITENGFLVNVYSKNYYDGNCYIEINNNIQGPFKNIDLKRITEEGKYMFTYWIGDEKTGGVFININGNVYGPFSHIEFSKYYLSNEMFWFAYKTNDGWYYNNNDVIFGPFDKLGNELFFKDSYCLTYRMNDEWNININGEIYKPDPNQRLSEYSGPYISCYENVCNIKTKDGTFLFTHEKTYGPFEYLREIHNKDEDFIYAAKKSEHTPYVFISNKNVSQIKEQLQNFILQNNKILVDDSFNHVFAYNDSYNSNKPYIIIDGMHYGKSYPLKIEYNKERNSFIWMALENRELVVYEYKL